MIQSDEYKNKIGKIMLNYRFDQFLNAGAFGAVFKGTDISNGNTVAIKLIKVESFDNYGGVVGELIVNEINIMKEIENDNIVKFLNYFQSTNYAYIIMEYCDGGDLEEYWKRNNSKLPPFEALKIMKQILNGMRGLHEKFVLHRDLKLANILINEDVIKIADLGFSCRIRHKNDLQNLQLGTVGTMAPEVASGQDYGLEADVFSVGAIFYQLLFGHLPFDNTSFDAFLYDIRYRKPTFYKVDSTYDDLLQDLLSKMLEHDRTKRITFAQIYDHQIMHLQAPRGSLIDKGSVKLNSVDFTKSQQFYKDNPVIRSNEKLPILDLNSQEQDQIVEVEEDNIDSVKVIPINQQRNKNVSQPNQQENQNNLQSEKFNGRTYQKVNSILAQDQNYQIQTPQEDTEGQKRRKIDYGCKIHLDFYNYIQTLIQLSEDLQLVQYKSVYPVMYPRLQLQKLIYFKQYDLMDDIRKKKNEFNLDYIDEILETQEIKYIYERLYKEVAESKELYCQSIYSDLKSNFKYCQQYIDEQQMSSAKISFDKDFHKNFKTSMRQLRDYLYQQENDNVKQSDQMLRIILNITNLLNLSNKEFKQLYGRVKTMDINSLLKEVNYAIKSE